MAHDPMAEIRASFFVECEELLESLQDALTALDTGAQDSETVHVVFRAVHSIKGGAGAFSLTALVTFAHRFETVLDALRAGRLAATAEAVRLFFRAADLLQDHVIAARDAGPPPADEAEVLQALDALAGSDDDETAEVTDFQPMALSFDFAPPIAPDLAAAGPAAWQIRFLPRDGFYPSGNEPLVLLRALARLGAIETRCLREALPPLDALDPEQPLLGWSVRLRGPSNEAEVREVFEFVEDICDIGITALPGEAAPAPADAAPADPPATTALPLADRSAGGAGPAAPAPPTPATPAPTFATPESAAPTPTGAATPAPAPAAPAPTPPAATTPAAAEHATVRVDLDRVDRLVNLVGELVINQAMLAQSVTEAGLPANSAVMNGLEAFMMLTRDIQDSVMMIRAQPVKPLFQRLARIVRESSAALGKEVRLLTEGEATEVDKTVIERLADPLTHMIRNAVDHGLERPEARLAAGKPRDGVITLSAQHRAGRVLIEIADDGAGIDRARVREIAVAKGLIAADAALSDAETDALLFLPGFSTATTVSALSGRGVGMDVVRQAIQSLGGRVVISSDPGRGTRFSISLPLTLAVLDGMVVKVAGETLVVPLSAILETATLGAEDVRALGPQTSVIRLRDAFVPLYDLGAELGYRSPKPSYDGGIVLLCAQENGNRAALVVDAIMEQRQVVIKGLQQSCGRIPGVAAATILGDGQIALILDPADLVHNATGRSRVADLALAG